MSASRIRHKFIQSLDFGNQKLSKRYVRRVLKSISLDAIDFDARTGNITRLEHEVKVGVYNIHLRLPSAANGNIDPIKLLREGKPIKKLSDYKKICIDISMVNKTEEEDMCGINIYKNKLFCSQRWVFNQHCDGWIRINDLVDAILYCNRLTKLKAFL
ncbi:MAG: hypothetical protein WCT07_03995 [Candidatus Paceibacterota bacterium]